MLLLQICFLIAGGRAVVLLFPCETELIWCRRSRHLLSQGTWARRWWGEAFSITCLCIPRGTDDKDALSCVANLSWLKSKIDILIRGCQQQPATESMNVLTLGDLYSAGTRLTPRSGD